MTLDEVADLMDKNGTPKVPFCVRIMHEGVLIASKVFPPNISGKEFVDGLEEIAIPALLEIKEVYVKRGEAPPPINPAEVEVVAPYYQ